MRKTARELPLLDPVESPPSSAPASELVAALEAARARLAPLGAERLAGLTPPDRIALLERLDALEAAALGDDPHAVAEAARAVLALAPR